MKKIKKVAFLAMMMVILLLVGCNKNEKKMQNQLYYISTDETSIVEEPLELEGVTVEDQIEFLIEKLNEEINSKKYERVLPNHSKIDDYQLEDEQLKINIKGVYYDKIDNREILTRAILVKTFLQIPEISYLSITVNYKPLADKNGNAIGLLTMDSFVENPGRQLSTIQEASLQLFFSSKDGTQLVSTVRDVHYNSNISMEKLVVEQLIEGPKSKDMLGTIPSNTKLLSINTTDGICYVNFNEGIKKQTYDIGEPIIIYSIVNSLCELPNVSQVQISVNGDNSGVYRDKMPLNVTYKMNLDYLSKEDE